MSLSAVVLIIFIVILLLIFLKYMYYSSNTLSYTLDAKTSYTISASSLSNNSTNSAPSNFSYSMWIYINNWNYRYGQSKVILGRMGGKSSSSSGTESGIDGVFGSKPCPVLSLGAIDNSVTCAISCYPTVQDVSDLNGDVSDASGNDDVIVHTCSLNNVPIQSWVQLAIVVNNQTMDFYMNGKIVKTCILPGPANIDNTADVIITPGGGFDGYTANVQYWPAPKNPQEMYNVYEKGYTNSIFGNLFNTYSFQLNISENGISQGTLSL